VSSGEAAIKFRNSTAIYSVVDLDLSLFSSSETIRVARAI
jgi:hypothetical protein